MIEHHIQNDIIDRLSTAKTLRFSELKPSGMESNLFMYHLKQLSTNGYVRQNDDKTYTLTSKGLGYVDTLTLTNKKPRKQPKVITILALKNAQKEYLFAQRLRQPSLHTWMIPSGKQHFGESPEAHVARELREQFGHETAMIRRGLLDIRIHQDDTVVTHLTAHVYAGSYDGEAPQPNDKFSYEWHARDDKLDVTPGTKELLDAIEGTEPLFFLSLDVAAD